MARFLSIFLFFLYKAGEVALSYYALTYFKMRYDLLLIGFYGFLSLFQMLFVFIQSLSRPKESGYAVTIFQYTTILTILMELVALGMAGYYLMMQENDLYNLFLIATALTPMHIFYYLIHGAVFSTVIRKNRIKVTHTSVFPVVLFLVLTFGIPAFYILYKTFNKGQITSLDISLITGIFILNGIAAMILFITKASLARKIANHIMNFSLSLYNQTIVVDDPNEFGYIQTQLAELNKKLQKDKEKLTFFNDYLSQNMRTQITKYGINQTGEEKTAAISTLRYHISEEGIQPDRFLKIQDALIEIIGEYADEYEAYPLFESNRIHVCFGIPYYYEHQKYNAIEATQKILEDIEKLSAAEEVKISASAGIHTGSVITGPVHTRGKEYREYLVFGKGLETSDKLAALAESMNLKIIACINTVQGLENKFFPEKTYKIKMKNGEEISAYQMRL